MVSFKEFLLNESYKNLTSREEKEKYAEEVFFSFTIYLFKNWRIKGKRLSIKRRYDRENTFLETFYFSGKGNSLFYV